MNHNKSELYFLLILLTGIFILAFFIFKLFLFPLILAVVFATVFGPVHKRALVITRERNVPAALLTTVFVLIVVIVPLTFLGVQIFREATQFYSSLVESGGVSDISRSVSDAIKNLTGFSPVPLESLDVSQYLKQGLSWLLQHLGPFFANVARAMMGTFIFLVALYYLFKDGRKLKKAIVALSPLQDVHDEAIFSKLALAINSVIKGSLAVALIQGMLTGVGFAIFGIPNAVLWGSVAAVAALIPAIGTALVLLPAILYLFLSGETLFGIGLLLWGMTAVGLVDNFLGPKLVERGMQLHPFLILLSILGGIGFFGPLGFVLGPLVLSLLFALLEIYFEISKEHKGLS
ncbi:MAG: AI-2E family transporter [Candidatus Liptonbacteria bacterium]|nr:AI-2E family transporter [Candidatus Liptonbacteria bacterium]